MTTPAIRPEASRDYLRSLDEWLPAGARVAAAKGDVLAGQLCTIWQRYRDYRGAADWRCFVVARRLFVNNENGKGLGHD